MSVRKEGIDVIVVGGVADGLLVRGVKPDASFFELARPEYIKPLDNSGQLNPEVAKESDTYELHPIGLTNAEDEKPHLFGIAVVEGETLTWAFTQLVVGYVENVTNKLVGAGLIDKH